MADQMQKLIAEFLGTYMVVFTVALTKLIGDKDEPLKVFGGTAIAFVYAVMVFALGPISGAHLNPAVTFSMFTQKALKMQESLYYVLCQVGGGAAAGLSARFMYGAKTDPLASENGFDFWIGIPIVEFLYTFMLCFVFLNVTVKETPTSPDKAYAGIAIGFVLMAGAYGGGFVSGGAFNPAVAIGCEFMGPTMQVLELPIYLVVELAGAFCAVVAFHIVRPWSKHEEEAEKTLIPALTKLAYEVEKRFDPEDTSEFIGTFFLCLTISLNALKGEYLSNKNPPLKDPSGPASTLSNGACLMCMIYALGDVSGGVFNPALTLAYCGRWLNTGLGFGKEKLADPKIAQKELPKYMIAQMLGGVAGSGASVLIYSFSKMWPTATVGPGLYGPGLYYKYSQAFFAEAFGTFLLCFVALCVFSSSKPQKEYGAFAIGGCVIAAGYAWGPISGGVLNPAVSIANSVFNKLQLFHDWAPLLYIGAEFSGGVLAAVVFKLIYAHEYTTGDALEENLVADDVNA
jgi:aquaporin Z